jgi:pimeloyl-ACP methyl ester carboxylesterase
MKEQAQGAAASAKAGIGNAHNVEHRMASRAAAKKAVPFARVARLVGLAGRVAPLTVARMVRLLLFKPLRPKLPAGARAPLAEARVEYAVVGGQRICHYVWGDSGPRALLVHGWGGAAAQMTAFVEPLRGLGYQVIAIDLPAHGRSSGSFASVKHFEPCIVHAAKTYGDLQAVIAHSLGASAITFALSRGFVCARAAFLGPVTKYSSVWSYSERLLNLPPKVMPLMIEDAQKWLGITFDEMEPVQLAAAMSTPLLIVHDRSDREVPFEDGSELAASWSNAKLIVTDALGHKRGLRDPQVVRQVVAFVTAPPS